MRVCYVSNILDVSQCNALLYRLNYATELNVACCVIVHLKQKCNSTREHQFVASYLELSIFHQVKNALAILAVSHIAK